MLASGFLTKFYHSNNIEKVYADRCLIKGGNQLPWYMNSTSENKDLKIFLIISNIKWGGGTGEYLMVSVNRI